jgi:hypothetical protein
MLIFDRENWPLHRPWCAAVAAGTVAAVAWYAFASLGARTLPGGSSLPGFTFGVVGGAICVFEFLLWPRKKKRNWRVGRVQVWMRAHIWLGLLSLPLLVLHSGFTLGGSVWSLSSVLMILFLVVIASGVWGLAMQQTLPKRMLRDVTAETIYSQIGRLRGQFRAEAERLVLATCGPPEGREAEADGRGLEAAGSPAPHLVIGRVRSAGQVQGKVLETVAPTAPVPESEPLRAFFETTVAPFLTADDARALPLADARRAPLMFQDLRTKLDPRAYPAVDALEEFCNQRRQLDEQARLHRWLHNWLLIHLPLSAALMVLMVVHIFVALRYL